MKKSVKFVVVLILILFCTGCNGTVTRDIRHAGFGVSGRFICSNFYPKDKEDTSYEKIQYITDTHLITTEGKIYEVSFSQVYINKQNCKIADTSISVSAIMDSNIVRGTDSKYYYLMAQNGIPSYEEVPTSDNSYHIYNALLSDGDVIKVVTVNSGSGLYYVLKTDGNVHAYVVTRKDYNSIPVITSKQIVYYKSDYGSDIIDFNYAGSSPSTFVRTEDKVYRMIVQNKDECSKYADIPCKYEMQEDFDLEGHLDSIIAYNGKTLITDYKQIFTISGS